MEQQKIIYLFRDPIDVLFSYWPYLQGIPYKNFECPEHKNIISFAGEKYWGMDGIINFMNLQLDHHDKHKKKKLIIAEIMGAKAIIISVFATLVFSIEFALLFSFISYNKKLQK